jgi:hypothetical protein
LQIFKIFKNQWNSIRNPFIIDAVWVVPKGEWFLEKGACYIMKRNKRKFISVFLCLALILSVAVPMMGFAETDGAGTSDMAAEQDVFGGLADTLVYASDPKMPSIAPDLSASGALAEAPAFLVDAGNFPDEAFRNWLLNPSNIGGRGSDGILTPVEIAGITQINVSRLGISDLTGIRYFTSLTSLTCSDNNLSELDLGGLSSLTYLACSGNNLSELDLSGLTALTNLICSYNDLTELDLSEQTSLDNLECNDNNLEELDLSRLTSLLSFYCQRNNLSELDLGGLTSLTNLECTDNDLAELDLSEQPAMSALACSHNNLTELDLSGQAELYILNCDNNNLSELDLSVPIYLAYLECNDNNLTELDLSEQTSLISFSGGGQEVSLELAENMAGSWSLAIALNSPTFGEAAVSYADGILTSTNTDAIATTFTAETGSPGRILSGTMNLDYPSDSPPVTTSPAVYSVIDHFDIWAGSGTVSARIDADHAKFVRLTYNGVEIDPQHYTVTQGSTVITLKESHLDIYANGTHTLVAHFSDGHSENITLSVNRAAGSNVVQNAGTGTGSRAPQTGDEMGMVFWAVSLIVSILGLLCALAWRRRGRVEHNE